MLGLNIGPALWVAGFLGVAGFFWWGVDEIGDRREAIVNARWQKKLSDARIVDGIKARKRERRAADIADANTEQWAKMLADSETARRELEETLASRVRTVCYPKDIIKALNK